MHIEHKERVKPISHPKQPLQNTNLDHLINYLQKTKIIWVEALLTNKRHSKAGTLLQHQIQ